MSKSKYISHKLVWILALIPFITGYSAKTNTRKEAVVTPLIVGGREAERNEFPWLVRLEMDLGNDSITFCGGALIEMDVVLTAAHCVVGFSPSKITVVAGDHEFDETDPYEQRTKAGAVRCHEGFVDNEEDPDNFLNDIALIILSSNFTKTIAVRPIDLPSMNATINSTANSTGYVAGWGATEDNSFSSNVLRVVEVPIVTDSTCTSFISNPESQFCAGMTGKDSCQGDSGGPFICKSLNESVCGIVSYGPDDCGDRNYPGVYTKVSYYSSWIEENIVGGRNTGYLSTALSFRFIFLILIAVFMLV